MTLLQWKIIFEHQGRKTTILGLDYNEIVYKIRSLFPDQNHRRIEFYDPELTDYFEFISYEQIIDQPNGLRMKFDMSSLCEEAPTNTLTVSTVNTNDNSETHETIQKAADVRKPRKKPSLDHNV